MKSKENFDDFLREYIINLEHLRHSGRSHARIPDYSREIIYLKNKEDKTGEEIRALKSFNRINTIKFILLIIAIIISTVMFSNICYYLEVHVKNYNTIYVSHQNYNDRLILAFSLITIAIVIWGSLITYLITEKTVGKAWNDYVNKYDIKKAKPKKNIEYEMCNKNRLRKEYLKSKIYKTKEEVEIFDVLNKLEELDRNMFLYKVGFSLIVVVLVTMILCSIVITNYKVFFIGISIISAVIALKLLISIIKQTSIYKDARRKWEEFNKISNIDNEISARLKSLQLSILQRETPQRRTTQKKKKKRK